MPRTDIMQLDVRPARAAGVLLAAGGIGGALAEALRPHAGELSSFHQHMVAALTSSRWPAAEWAALIYFVVAAWALWQLLDSYVIADSPLARAGAHLAIIGATLMAVASSVAIAAKGEVAAYAAGQPAGLVHLMDPMQAVGFPAISLGILLVALGAGRRLAPRPVVAAAVIGGLAMAVAAVAVDGFHDIGAHQLLKVGGLANLWLIWAGVGLCFRSGKTATSPSSGSEPPRVAATTAGALR